MDFSREASEIALDFAGMRSSRRLSIVSVDEHQIWEQRLAGLASFT